MDRLTALLAGLGKIFNSKAVNSSPLKEDGSSRQYYRLTPSNSKASYILMFLQGKDAVDLENGTYSWIEIASTLEKEGILIPEIYHVLKKDGSLIIKDFGNITLEDKVFALKDNEKEIFSLYQKAAKIISQFFKIRQKSEALWCKRSFDNELFRTELDFFRIQCLHKFKEFHNPRDSFLFNHEIESLCHYLSQLPQHFVHRDFHSRNLMCVDSNLGVLDFQDARRGPAAYDIVSLCFDSYVPLEFTQREKIFQSSLAKIEEEHGFALKNEIMQSWTAVLLQRQLKAVGSFSYLTTKGKRDYTVFIPPALKILKACLAREERWPYLKELIPKLITLSTQSMATHEKTI